MQFAATWTSCVLLMTALKRVTGASLVSIGGAGDGGGGEGGGDGGGGDGEINEVNTRTSARLSTRDAPGSTIVTYHPETPPQSNAKGPYVEGAI